MLELGLELEKGLGLELELELELELKLELYVCISDNRSSHSVLPPVIRTATAAAGPYSFALLVIPRLIRN